MNNRSRLLILLSYLCENTDELHTVTLSDLMEYFHAQDETVTRKTLREDIATLQDNGHDIVSQRGKQNQYYLAKRQFEPAELKLLCDMVASNQFLSVNQSKELIRKLSYFASKYQQQALRKHTFHSGRIKLESRKNHYSTIDTITNAIHQRRQIAFQYTDYSKDKKKFLRHDGVEYSLSPYALIWDNGRYYMIGHSEYHDQIMIFRIDRIVHIRLKDETAVPRPKDFHVNEYTEQLFKMFGGELKKVVLECQDSVMNSLIDHFGEDVVTSVTGDHLFRAEITICLSPAFYSWIFQFGGKIRIISPQEACEEYIQMLRNTLSNY